MAIPKKSGGQPPKKTATQNPTGFGLGLNDIYTGPPSQNPGVLKAQADKAKRDSVFAKKK